MSDEFLAILRREPVEVVPPPLNGGQFAWFGNIEKVPIRSGAPEPHNDFLAGRAQARLFRRHVRSLLDRIKAAHGEDATLHVFPAMPVALAIEFGRVIMPKADLKMQLYDQNQVLGGFVSALTLP